MKTLLLVLFSLDLIAANSQAVGPLDSTIHSCNYKSTNILFTDIGIDTVYYGNGNNTNYYDAEYRAQQGCGDGLDRCIQTQNVALLYYAYYPKQHNYTATPLPCIIIEHGGSYSDCSGINNTKDIKRSVRNMPNAGG